MQKFWFLNARLKVKLSLPAQKHKCGILGLGMMKNSICTTREKSASPSGRVVIHTRCGLSNFFPP